MPRPKVNLVVLDPGSGRARPGAMVTFYHANTLDKPTLYADDDVATIGNPVQANGLGQVAVRVATGTYDVSMTFDGAQPTVVEDVLAWTPDVDVITSPGDLIIGGPEGENVRLAVGANGQVLLVENGLPAWKTLAGGVGLPTGTPGSLLSYGANNALSSILPGLQDQALAMMGGVPTWVSLLPPGTTLPISQPGDLVVGGPGGAVARLARGAPGDLLTVDPSGLLTWAEDPRTMARGRGDCFLGLTPPLLHLHQNGGTQLWIDGGLRTIPEAGVTLAPTGLTEWTHYYIYAAWTGSAIVLEASTTPFALAGGLAHKAGDESRTLVGQARTVGSPLTAGVAWWYAENERDVLSWFKHGTVTASAFLTAPRTITALTPTEVHTEIRTGFVCWDYAAVVLSVSGAMTIQSAGTTVSTYLTLDGAAKSGHAITSVTAGETMNIATTSALTLSTGYHTLSLSSHLSAPGSVTFRGDPGGWLACRTHALIT